MSDEGFWATPCEVCGANAGQECADDCGALIGTPPMARLAAAVHLLPYGNLVGDRGVGAPDYQEYDDADEYIERLADWMEQYQPIVSAMVKDLQKQSKQCISMKIERDVLDGVIRRALEGEPA
jgi:hypothetical protein